MKTSDSRAISGAAAVVIVILIIVVAGVAAYSLLSSSSTTTTSSSTTSPSSTTSSQMSSSTQTSTSQTVLSCVGVAQSNPDFSTLVTAIQDAGLVNTLSGAGPFTIFAPTNEAFNSLPAGVLNYLLSNKTALTQVLMYHVVSGDLMAAQVVTQTSLMSLQGSSIPVSVNGTTVKVGIATVTTPNVTCSNGVIHVIDHVLVPPGIMNIVQTAEYYSFNTLVTAVSKANLISALSGNSTKLTVFAPTDAAFAALPSGVLNYLLSNTTALTQVLTYHVASGYLPASKVVTMSSIMTLQGSSLPVNATGGVVKVGIATVTTPNIVCSNGIIHVINAVLVPGGILNVVQTAEYYDFSTLVTAVQDAGLVSTLSGPGPFTVFAPTNAAFAALPSGTLNSLLANKTALTSVLTYHVVSGEYLASKVVTLSSLMTVEGQSVTITVSGGNVKINGATVIEANVICSNGVIHVIDGVLLPPS